MPPTRLVFIQHTRTWRLKPTGEVASKVDCENLIPCKSCVRLWTCLGNWASSERSGVLLWIASWCWPKAKGFVGRCALEQWQWKNSFCLYVDGGHWGSGNWLGFMGKTSTVRKVKGPRRVSRRKICGRGTSHGWDNLDFHISVFRYFESERKTLKWQSELISYFQPE